MSQGTQLWQTLHDPITRSRQQPLVGRDHDVIMGQDPQLFTHCHSTNTQSEQSPLSAERRRFVFQQSASLPQLSALFKVSHNNISAHTSGAELYLFQSCTGRGKLVWVDREGIRERMKKESIFFQDQIQHLLGNVGRKIEKKVGEGGRLTIEKYFCENLRNPFSSSPHQVTQSINLTSFSALQLYSAPLL